MQEKGIKFIKSHGWLGSVNEEGVSHVIRLFMRHYTHANESKPVFGGAVNITAEQTAEHQQEMNNLNRVVCEEEALGDFCD